MATCEAARQSNITGFLQQGLTVPRAVSLANIISDRCSQLQETNMPGGSLPTDMPQPGQPRQAFTPIPNFRGASFSGDTIGVPQLGAGSCAEQCAGTRPEEMEECLYKCQRTGRGLNQLQSRAGAVGGAASLAGTTGGAGAVAAGLLPSGPNCCDTRGSRGTTLKRGFKGVKTGTGICLRQKYLVNGQYRLIPCETSGGVDCTKECADVPIDQHRTCIRRCREAQEQEETPLPQPKLSCEQLARKSCENKHGPTPSAALQRCIRLERIRRGCPPPQRPEPEVEPELPPVSLEVCKKECRSKYEKGLQSKDPGLRQYFKELIADCIKECEQKEKEKRKERETPPTIPGGPGGSPLPTPGEPQGEDCQSHDCCTSEYFPCYEELNGIPYCVSKDKLRRVTALNPDGTLCRKTTGGGERPVPQPPGGGDDGGGEPDQRPGGGVCCNVNGNYACDVPRSMCDDQTGGGDDENVPEQTPGRCCYVNGIYACDVPPSMCDGAGGGQTGGGNQGQTAGRCCFVNGQYVCDHPACSGQTGGNQTGGGTNQSPTAGGGGGGGTNRPTPPPIGGGNRTGSPGVPPGALPTFAGAQRRTGGTTSGFLNRSRGFSMPAGAALFANNRGKQSLGGSFAKNSALRLGNSKRSSFV